MAADFQESMTSLVTGAGESQAAIGKVSKGILSMAPVVGESTSQLASGMYMIESAGYHGAAGLTVLKAAAEGAKVGSADLGTVADALTTALNDYHMPASAAAQVTSQLVETVASGKTHMQDLAGSLAAVLPAASSAHVSLQQVLGAMATMTAKGTPAADAATYLRQTILQLSNPSKAASDEMKLLGLNATNISQNLGSRGLTGTLAILQTAIEQHKPVDQTFVGALASMVGGAKSMQAALELTGSSTATFNHNVKAIAGTTADAKGNVQGWNDVQKDFNTKMGQAQAAVEVLGIKLGQKLIPVIITVIGWMQKHSSTVEILAIALGVTLVAGFAAATVAAMSFWTAATAGIGLLVVAMIGGIVYVATHWHQSWTDIKNWFDDAVKFLRSGFGTLALLILGPLAPLAILALHWQQVWAGIKTVIASVIPPILTWFRRLGDGFFDTIQGILSAGSHLPFVGHYFAQANNAVKQAHQDFDNTLTSWATDATNLGKKVGSNTIGGVTAGVQAGTPQARAQAQVATAQVIKGMRLGGADESQVKAAGADVGQSMMQGVNAGIQIETPSAGQQAAIAIAQVGKNMREAAMMHSPSGLTIPIGESMAEGIVVGLQNKIQAAMKAGTMVIAGVTGAMAGPAGQYGSYQALGQQMAGAYGWGGGAEWTALNNVAMRESGWNPNAQNPTSSAYGIAQNIQGRSGYPDPSPAGQIAWMLAYIKSRYGDPIGAWQHEMSYGWYDQGGILPPGLTLAVNTTGGNEYVGGPGGTTIVVQVAGSVVTEGQLVDTIHTGLLQKQRRAPLGIKAS
jgi:TP901 family phage tail tape measure protein